MVSSLNGIREYFHQVMSKRCSDPHSNVRQRSWNPTGEGEEVLQELEASSLLTENSQNELIWAQRIFQRLNQQPGILHGTNLGTPYVCDSCVAWSTNGTPSSGSTA